MFLSCTLKDGIVYLPTTAKTVAGFYLSCEPVAVVPVANTEALRRALQDVMDRGNAIIPTPKRDAFPPPVLPKYAGARSWSAFMRGASEWKIDKRDGIYEIVPYRKDPDGGPSWVPDRKGRVDFPAGTKRDDVIDRRSRSCKTRRRSRGSRVLKATEFPSRPHFVTRLAPARMLSMMGI